MYEIGRGVPQNYVLAHMWFSSSAVPGLLHDGLSVIGLSSGNSNCVGLVIGTFIFFSSC
jgi:hypothetical protein